MKNTLRQMGQQGWDGWQDRHVMTGAAGVGSGGEWRHVRGDARDECQVVTVARVQAQPMRPATARSSMAGCLLGVQAGRVGALDSSEGAQAWQGRATSGPGAPSALAGGGHLPQRLVAADGQDVLGVVNAKQAAQVPAARGKGKGAEGVGGAGGSTTSCTDGWTGN